MLRIWLNKIGYQLQVSICGVDQREADDKKLKTVFVNFYKCAWVVHNLVKHAESLPSPGWMKQITKLILEVSLSLLILLLISKGHSTESNSIEINTYICRLQPKAISIGKFNKRRFTRSLD
jgi:hypothetical protein